MAVQEPRPNLTEQDRRVIHIVADLLLEYLEGEGAGGNCGKGYSLLPEEKAVELLDLIEAVLGEKQIRQKISFVENVGFLHDEDTRFKRLWFKSARRSTTMSGSKWAGFKRRLGQRSAWYPQLMVQPMSFDYFIKMERRLFASLGLHPRVVELLIDLIYLHEKQLERRRAEKGAPIKIVSRIFNPILSTLRNRNEVCGGVAISNNALASIVIILSNCGILFTTRDWDVTGVLSTVAGAMVGIAVNAD